MEKIIAKTLEDLKKFNWEVDVLSYDWETTSLDYTEMQPVGISFCNGEQAIYIDLEDFDKFKQFLRSVFCFNRLYIAHNQPFDLKCNRKFLRNRPKKIFCTMTAAHLLNENIPKNLKYLAEKVLKVPKSEISSWEEAKEFGIHSPQFYKYGMNDAIWAYQLWEIESKKLIEKDLEKLYSIEMPFQFVLVNLEVNGIQIDEELLEEYIKKAKKLQHQFLEKMCNLLDVRMIEQRNLFGDEIEYITPVNFDSGKQIAEILINKFHINLPMTEKGNYITDVNTLTPFRDKCKFVKYILLYRQVSKLLNTYLLNIKAGIVDGRLRANFNNCIAVTGRLSSSNPNLQNIPHPNEDIDINIRKLFIAPKGKKLIVVDYSGQEWRGAAHISQDENMIEALRNDKDPHLTTADRIFGLSIPEKCLYKSHSKYKEYKEKFAEERFKGKNSFNFPIIYGATEFRLAKELGVTVNKAKEYLDLFFKLYPRLKYAIINCHNFLRSHRFVRTELGRYRRLYDLDNPKSFRQAFNHLIQGLFADILRIAANNIMRERKPEWDLKLVLTVHDELVYEVNEKYAREVKGFIRYEAENAYKLSVELPVDIKVTDRYGDVK